MCSWSCRCSYSSRPATRWARSHRSGTYVLWKIYITKAGNRKMPTVWNLRNHDLANRTVLVWSASICGTSTKFSTFVPSFSFCKTCLRQHRYTPSFWFPLVVLLPASDCFVASTYFVDRHNSNETLWKSDKHGDQTRWRVIGIRVVVSSWGYYTRT